MKTTLTCGFAGLLALGALDAQTIVPANPQKFTSRPIGGGTSGGVDVIPRDGGEAKARYVTHVILSDDRQWTSVDGRVLSAKLLAFEDLVVEGPKGAAPPPLPTPPANPTVVRDGKIRLLAAHKSASPGRKNRLRPSRDARRAGVSPASMGRSHAM